MGLTMTIKKLLLTVIVCLSAISAHAGEGGIYICHVEGVHGSDDLGQYWKNAELVYDADKGKLSGVLSVAGKRTAVASKGSKLFSRLTVKTGRSERNHLIATQHDPIGYHGNVRPVMVWLQIETMDNPASPKFKFFSSTTRVIVEGRCEHHG
jgi:hypothetical protein